MSNDSPGPDDLRDYLDAASQAAHRAAGVLDEWRPRLNVREKGRFDLVTDADLAAQRAICEHLNLRFPGHQFLGEEDKGSHARPREDAPPTWIIDPIDGTTNFIHDCPFYCISIGLQVAGELVVGVIFDPTRRELFQAVKGQGAWLDKRRLATSSTSRLAEALVAVGFPANILGREVLLDYWRSFCLQSRALRRTGSTALNLAYLAAGRFDAYWAFDNHVWDVAAGVVLVREAGGMFTKKDGTPYDPYVADCVASNGPLHPELLAAFR